MYFNLNCFHFVLFHVFFFKNHSYILINVYIIRLDYLEIIGITKIGVLTDTQRRWQCSRGSTDNNRYSRRQQRCPGPIKRGARSLFKRVWVHDNTCLGNAVRHHGNNTVVKQIKIPLLNLLILSILDSTNLLNEVRLRDHEHFPKYLYLH